MQLYWNTATGTSLGSHTRKEEELGKSTVFANGQGISSEFSEGESVAGDDTCLTPVGTIVVPVQYNNTAYSKDIREGTLTVKTDKGMSAIQGCNYYKSTGDEPGVALGVNSGTMGDKAEFANWSFDVKHEGKGVGRNSDLMTHNNGNATGTNYDSASVPPKKKISKKTLPPGEVIFKLVEHLSWDAWNVAGKGFYLGHEKNKPVKDMEFFLTLPRSKEPHIVKTNADGIIRFTGQINDGLCTLEWQCPDTPLNNTYLWFYEGTEPLMTDDDLKNIRKERIMDTRAKQSTPDTKAHLEILAGKGYPHTYWPLIPQLPRDNPANRPTKWNKTGLTIGRVHLFSVYRPPVVVDSHMHIQSNHCAPMPPIWDKIPLLGWKIISTDRSTIENLGKILNNAVINTVKAGVYLSPSSILFASRVEDDAKKAGDKAEKKFDSTGMGKTAKLGQNETWKIGDEFIKEQTKAFNHLKSLLAYKDTHLVLPAIIMPMDMEYAHIDGYFGIKIYNGIYNANDTEMERPTDYWYPYHGMLTKASDDYLPAGKDDKPTPPIEKHGNRETAEQISNDKRVVVSAGEKQNIKIRFTPCLLDKEETKKYENWKKQLKQTEFTVLKYPLRFLPLYHYDPRRWQAVGTNTKPVEAVSSNGLYLGFKMYTSQGYRPWDVRRLPIMEDFYLKCIEQDIPIMNHCTPEGMYSMDRDYYFHFRHPADTKEDDAQKFTGYEFKSPSEQIRAYFNDHFISPHAWKKVLDASITSKDGKITVPLKNLRLCLAHFGGNTDLGRKWGMDIIEMMKTYPNLHTDISSSFADREFRSYFIKWIIANPGYQHLKNRILFGTDWYMTLLDNVEYEPYYEEAKKTLDSIDTSLWVRFTLINPIRFYKLHTQIGRIAENIIKRRNAKGGVSLDIEKDGKKDTVKLDKLETKQIKIIRKEAALITKVHDIHKNYWEYPYDKTKK